MSVPATPAAPVAPEEKAKREAEEKLKRLPTPEREKLLQRRKKFEGNLPVKSVAKKISLKRSGEDNNQDAISLSVDDTLDMFEEDNNRSSSKNLSRRQVAGMYCHLLFLLPMLFL